MENPKKDKISILVIFCIAIIGLWIISNFILPLFIPSDKERALWGDSFGGLNSLFSGMAFAGIIYTILLQRKELKLQREELALTRVELKKSALAQEKSAKELRRQSENLKITAKLNAMNTLISHFKQEAAESITINGKNPFQDKWRNI